ncbi:MAG: hypothetical protein ACE5I3_06100 [Phycisphaerae bacterium]
MLSHKHRKRSLGILLLSAGALAAWAFLGLPGGALADHKPNHNPPGQGGDGDTVAPDPVTDLVAQAGALGAITLTWTAVGDDGGGTECSGAGRASDYDMRYSTGSPADPPYSGDAEAWFADATPALWEPLPFLLSGPGPCGWTERFCISSLELGVTYYVALKAEDEAGNVSGVSNVASAMPGEALGLFMHVDDIFIQIPQRAARRDGVALVTILDENGVPVEGATVIGDWTGCNFNGQSDSAVTDCNGLAVIQKNGACRVGDFCNVVFTVTDVTHDVAVYDPAASVETSDSMICF